MISERNNTIRNPNIWGALPPKTQDSRVISPCSRVLTKEMGVRSPKLSVWIGFAFLVLLLATSPAHAALKITTEYLYNLAKTFSRFYDKKLGVRVIDASPDSLRASRLHLCDLTARTLQAGLHLLGIETLEEM